MIAPMDRETVVYTLGHGDRELPEFLECLESFEIRVVADVRSYPASRKFPRFSREALEPAVAAAGLSYRWLGRELGGFRPEGYGAHMETELYREGFARLREIAREAPTCLLCAERDPAGCHRRHLARALEERGLTVRHIVSPGRVLLPGEGPEDQGTLFPL
jgi:uncharacterized protein (DUF488 family)